MRNRRVVLTGATGFIGHYCLWELLRNDFEVHALCRRPDTSNTDVKWHAVDLLDSRSASALLETLNASYLLHTAWITTPGEFWTNADNDRWMGASRRLFEHFGAAGGERIVGVGSCAEYDWTDGVCREEETPLEPATLYGRCKLEACRSLEKLAREYGIGWAWGRVFFIYGPGEPHEKLVPAVAGALLAGEEVETTDGRQVRDFIYVEDAARALVGLLDVTSEGAFNIGSGEGVAVRHVIEEIGALTGRGDGLVRFGARTAPTPEPPCIVADISKLRAALSWHPRYTLREGLRREIDAIRNRDSQVVTESHANRH
ncbi:MAG: NAD(P)-dependent oxidoreductase [Gammaproteobacteria bacterium]|nr:NAD(P)-dependent oxidoreductase [Gammaproteobacteria bacterium]